MKYLNTKKIFKALVVFAALILFLLIGIFISINLIVDPIIYWLASTTLARIAIAGFISWLGVAKMFDVYYQRYRRRKKNQRFNALNVPYPRIFRGRK